MTHTEKKVYNYYIKCLKERMYPPTLQEIADDCGGDFKTRERARQVIGQLVKKGYLKKVRGNQEVYYPLK